MVVVVVGSPRLMVLSGSTWQCGNISSVFSIFGLIVSWTLASHTDF